MDLRYRGHPELAARFLRVYAEAANDFHLYRVVDWYQCYRATVRGAVAALVATDSKLDATQRERAAESELRHLALAEEFLENRGPGSVVLVCGSIGSGKSTAARALADRIEGVVICADRVRKHLAGMAPTERTGHPDALYDAAARTRVYEGVLTHAADVVATGRVAILDATWSSRKRRSVALDWAAQRGVSLHILETRAAQETVLDRLVVRRDAGTDASDAGPERLAASLAEFEPFDPETERHWIIRTDVPDWRDRLDTFAQTIHGRAIRV
jgi:predicted kinase